jgi:hypothetical protein
VHKRLQYLVGRQKLVEGKHMRSVMEAVITFLTDCADDNFLDFIEYIFRTDDYRKFWSQRDYLVADINDFLLVDNVPYG